MSRILLIIVLTVTAVSVWFMTMGAAGFAKKTVTQQLQEAGFKDADIINLSAGPRHVTASDIKLDKTGIDSIRSISFTKGWLNSLWAAQDADILIEAPDIYRTVNHVNALLPGLMALSRDTLMSLPDGQVTVRDGRLSIASPMGDFQFLFDVVIEPVHEKRRMVHAMIKSTQPAMDFTSEWRGWIEADGTLLADALIPEMKAHIGPVRLTRGNGWLSLSNTGEYPQLTGQIESGAATLNSLALQNFSLTLDATHDSITTLMRASAGGASKTIFAADITLEKEQREIALTLSSDNIPEFLTYLDHTVDRRADSLRKVFSGKKTLRLHVDYQLAKRFTGGPYPFDMRGSADDAEFMSGTFLVYPGTYDMRGSARVDSAYLPGIQSYFKLPANVVSGEYIRLDASLAPLISGVSAGVENNAGE